MLAAQGFVIQRLPDFINSPADEITPVLSRDGRTLYFTRAGHPDFDHTLWLDSVDLAIKLSPEAYRTELAAIYSEISNTKVLNPETSRVNQDIWIAHGDSLGFNTVEHPGPPLNNALPNSLVTLTPDPNAFYIINQFKPDGYLKKGFSSIRRQADGTWSWPDSIIIEDYFTLKSEVNLTMSYDGQVLILSATRDDSKDMDLYVCFRQGKNRWSAPQSLGFPVNSNQRETTPYLSEDNTTLFFASTRFGSSDIYMSNRLDDSWTNWTLPVRLTEPINSTADDSQPYFNMSSGYLYLTSRRGGSSDIFRVSIAPPQPTEMVIQGRIFNGKTHEIMFGSSVFYSADWVPANTLLAENGFFTIKIPKGLAFQFTPMKEGFIGRTKAVEFRRDYYYFQDYYLIDFYLDPLEVDAKIEMRPIFFEQSKATILEVSYTELERLATIMQTTPTLQIQVQGHTDNLGRVEDLMRLSEDRAQAIKDFLVKRGIAANRISTIGYGPKFPVTDNSSDDQRALNRRVEIRITKI